MIHVHYSGCHLPGLLIVSFIKHASEHILSSAAEKLISVYSLASIEHIEEQVQSHLPLSLSPSDGTL